MQRLGEVRPQAIAAGRIGLLAPPYSRFVPLFKRISAAGVCIAIPLCLVQSDCGLQFGNEALSFASCQSVTSELGTDMTVHWTVVDSGNGNSTLRGAIDAAHSANSIDWAGFGFNPQLEMIGGNALVVKACSSCSSGTNGKLSSDLSIYLVHLLYTELCTKAISLLS